jgi:hypothetical protein
LQPRHAPDKPLVVNLSAISGVQSCITGGATVRGFSLSVLPAPTTAVATGRSLVGRLLLPLVVWVCSAVLLSLGLTRPIIEIAVNIEGVLQDALDRQPIVGLMLQEHGLNVANIASKLPPSNVTRKSIVSSVANLMRLRCYTAATLILLFSVVVPIAKQLALLLVVVLPPEASARLNGVTRAIHKWAMMDVFVLAMVVLALSSATAWNAALLDGFYWFLGYFFTAAALGLLVSRRLRAARRSPVAG